MLVTLETAKLSKDKGFNEYCENAFDVYQDYNSENIKDKTAIEFFDRFVEDLHDYKNYRGVDAKENYLYQRDISDDMYILRPTQSELQEWLREKYKIHIEILSEDNPPYEKFYYRLNEIGKYFRLSHDGFYDLKYEIVLEKALQEALKSIKDVTKR